MAMIVLAEDEFLIAEMMADFLRDAGHEVRTAAHGRGALKLVRDLRPDILITDYMMPLMTGVELAETIRSDPELKALPIVLVSGAQAHLARSRAELFTVILEKPYTPLQLTEVLAEVLGAASR
ncbi:response regulator [Acidisoma sp. 7E03]